MAGRQVWFVIFEGPALNADPRNPRQARSAAGRGAILARDGTFLAVTRNGKRIYPGGAAFAHAVGYASARFGTAGLEDAFDRALMPEHAASDPLETVFEIFSGSRPPAQGADVTTTLDPVVQHALLRGLAPFGRAAGIVLDPRTGAVLALASVPGFDPNTLEADFARLSHDERSPLLDRATSGLYPPGSTFKIITAADALDAGVVTPATMFDDTGGFAVGNFVVRNDEEERTGRQNLSGAFALSSNVDFARIAIDLRPDRWYAYAARWQLAAPLPFDLPVSRDRLPPADTLSPSMLAQLGFGQASLLVTPLRMALITATIAHGGVMPQPFIVRTIARPAQTPVQTRAATLGEPISAQTASAVRDMMIAVVTRGTGTAAGLPNVSVAGKTGTATNPHGKSHAWFVAFAPAAAPRIAVAIVIENVGYGGSFAAPVAKRVLQVALGQEEVRR